MSRTQFVSVICVSVLMLSGCGRESWKAKLYPASGTCHVNGEPAVKAMMLLYPVNGPVDARQTVPFSVVNEDGTFRLSTYEHGDGIPAGEYAMTFYWLACPEVGISPDRLKDRYRSRGEPLQTVTIIEGENQIPSIDLTISDLLPPQTKDEALSMYGGVRAN